MHHVGAGGLRPHPRPPLHTGGEGENGDETVISRRAEGASASIDTGDKWRSPYCDAPRIVPAGNTAKPGR